MHHKREKTSCATALQRLTCQKIGKAKFRGIVLQDMLTPVEHLLFFGRLKNLQASKWNIPVHPYCSGTFAAKMHHGSCMVGVFKSSVISVQKYISWHHLESLLHHFLINYARLGQHSVYYVMSACLLQGLRPGPLSPIARHDRDGLHIQAAACNGDQNFGGGLCL